MGRATITILIGITLGAVLMYLTMIKPYEEVKQHQPPCKTFEALNSLYVPARCWKEIKW